MVEGSDTWESADCCGQQSQNSQIWHRPGSVMKLLELEALGQAEPALEVTPHLRLALDYG